MKRVHVWVSGKVQRVAFRANAQREAELRGLTGWVRNLSDGRVEAVVEGPPAAVEDWARWCHMGNPPAKVDTVTLAWEQAQAEEGFRILPTM